MAEKDAKVDIPTERPEEKGTDISAGKPAGNDTEKTVSKDISESHDEESSELKGISEGDLEISREEGTADSKLCGPCSKEESEDSSPVAGTAFCYDCNEYLCPDCIKFHKKFKVTCRHRVIEVQDLDEDVSYMDLLELMEACTVHEKKVLEYYCKDHDALCCSQCAIGTHRRCSHVSTLFKVSKSVREDTKHDKLKHDLARYRDHINAIVTKDEENLDAMETDLLGVPSKLDEFRARVESIVDAVCSRITEDAEASYNTEREKLSEHLARAKLVQKAIKDSFHLLESAIVQGSNSQLFIAINMTSKSMDDLERSLRHMHDSSCNFRVEVRQMQARLLSLEKALEVEAVKSERDIGPMPKRKSVHERPPRPTPESFFSRRRGYRRDPLID